MKRLTSLGVGIAAVAMVAACGGGSGSSDSGGSSSTGAGQSASSGANSQCVTDAKAKVDAARAVVDLKAPPRPLALDKLSGKKVWVINAVDTPLLLEIVDGFKAGAKAAGMEVQVVSAKGSASRMVQGTAEAVAQKAAGIMLLATDPRLVSGPLQKAKAAGIPVVDSLVGGPDAPNDEGQFAHVEADMKSSGGVVGDWILADSNCNAHVAVMASTVLSVHRLLTAGSTGEIKRLCPSCTAEEVPFDSTKMATDLGSNSLNVLRRNPKINYLFPVLDAGVQFVVPAVQQAGKADSVKVVSHDGVNTNIENMRKGVGQVADVAFPPAKWIGWAEFDQTARGILKEEPVDWTIPTRLIDKTNVGTDDAQLFPAYQGFEEKFTAAWKGAS
ncbi:MAG: ribose transport system substrate-binding protein [Solirubrobacteraceae bacterium]|nr:ribose transport system substrate-binding protein [Solirubrobacteraceae bacterium]